MAKKIAFVDLKKGGAKFGLTKVSGYSYTSTGRPGVFIDGKFCSYTAQNNAWLPQLGKYEKKKSTFKCEDFFSVPMLPTQLRVGDMVETNTGVVGAFSSYNPQTDVITICTTGNEIVEARPSLDTFFNLKFIKKLVPIFKPKQNPNKYEFWKEGGAKLRNEIMLHNLGIAKDNVLYKFLLDGITVNTYIANCPDFNQRFTNTLATDITRASMVVLVANHQLNEVVNYSLAAKIYGVSLEAFDGDRRYFEKHKIPITESQLADFINDQIINDFTGNVDVPESPEGLEADDAEGEAEAQ